MKTIVFDLKLKIYLKRPRIGSKGIKRSPLRLPMQITSPSYWVILPIVKSLNQNLQMQKLD